MIITAKFAAVCPCCSGRINAGDRIEWSKGEKARHVSCAGKPVAKSAPRPAAYSARRSYGKWTGCSCGSREDSYGDLIPSPRNCASCEHDA